MPYLFTAWSFHRMIPRTVALTPILEGKACPRLAALVDELGKFGFEQVVGPLRYNSRPPSQLSLLLHEEEPVYAAVLRVRVFGLVKVHYSLLSPFVRIEGHLESTATHELDAVRAPDFVRLQVIPGAEPAGLLRRHMVALYRLRREGREFQTPTASELEREAVFSLALTGVYLRRNAYRLALGIFAYALTRTPRNPSVFKQESEAASDPRRDER
jgi:hypothetical protein